MSGEGDLKLAEKFEKATVVLIDIAGTSSSICFVKDTLFPYVLNKSESYLTDKWENSEVQDIVKALRENDSEILKEGEKDAIIKSIASSIKSLTEKNSDLKEFKTLQGLIYKQGYEAGDLKGHVFPDVATQLPIWANGKKVYVYSTGSVEAQKLLFTHSSEGNLAEHISEYFDMSVGSKTEAASYKTIAEKIKCKPEEIIYLTDAVAEANAATEAGVNTVLVSREGNEEISEDDKKKYSVITTFSELSVETSGKRKINEDGEQEAPPAKVAKTDPEKESEKVEDAPPAEAEEKMEVDTPEVPVESKVDEPMEKCNDSETVTSTSEVNDKADEKIEADAVNSTGDKEKPAPVEEKPAEEKIKDVPSTDKVQEETKTEEKADNKTEEDKKVVSDTKTEETEKHIETTESTETKESENKETDKETVVEKGKETVDSSDKKDKEETKETVDSSKETKPEPKVKTEETTDKTDKDCKVKNETEVSENVKTESEVAKVEEKPEDTKPTEKNKEPAPKTDEKTAEKNENVAETNQATKETNDVPETKENSESTVDGKTEEAKPDPEKEKESSGTDNDEQKSKNGDTKENGNTEDKDKSEEKENKSELANGAHIENGDEKKLPEEESEIKVKKIESENTETEAAVSVEVTA